MMEYDRWMNAEPPEPDPWAGNDPFDERSPWDRGNNPWQGRDTWVGDVADDRSVWEAGTNGEMWSLNSCVDPGEFTYVVGIFLQVSFIFIYGSIYYCCFRENKSVTKMHIFVFYINTSVWGWAIYLLLYKGVCGGHNYTQIYIWGSSFLGIACLCSCIEMCCSREGGYFRHQKTMNECIQYMKRMKETAPVHRVEIECYHYRIDYDTDRDGRTTTRRTKVTTYREWRDFLYDRWLDESDYPNLPEICMETPIVAVESTTSVAPGDDFTRMQFHNFRTNLVEENRFRDAYIDETVRRLVPGHVSSVTAKSEKENEVPWWLNTGLFYCLACLFCSCPLRVLFRSKSKQHKFEIRKVYYLDPEGPYIDNMGVNVTVNIIDNKGTVNVGGNPEGIPMVLQGPANSGQQSPGPAVQPHFPPASQKYSSPAGQQYDFVGQQYPQSTSQQYPKSTSQQYPQSTSQQSPGPAVQPHFPAASQKYSSPASQQYPESTSQQYSKPPPPATQPYATPQKGRPSAPASYQQSKPTAPPASNPNFP